MLASYTPIEPPSSQEAKKPQADQKTKKRPGPTKDPIHPDVRSKLEKSEDGTVYVLVTLKPLPKEGLTKEQRKTMTKEKQDKLAAGEFEVDHRFGAEPRMIGYINAAGIAKLKEDSRVLAVQPSRIWPQVFAELEASTSGKVGVIVSLTRAGWSNMLTVEGRVPIIKTIQDRVLGRVTPYGFDLEFRFKYSSGFSGQVGAAGLEKLATDEDVVGVGSGFAGSSSSGETDGASVPSRGIALSESVPFLRADQVHALGYTGNDVTVAVIDSGVNCGDPDVVGSCVGPGIGFYGGATHPGETTDNIGHGTAMAAIITASGVGGSIAPGVAPDAKILPIKIADVGPGNQPTPQNYILGIEYVIDERAHHSNLRVICLAHASDCPWVWSSCSCEISGNPALQLIQDTVEAARLAGIITFVSSGNHGRCGALPAPACVSAAVPIAAVYDDTPPYFREYCWCPCSCIGYCDCEDSSWNPGQVTCFSDRPPPDCPLLGAPGADISLTTPTPSDWGTSPAAAHAAGVAALMIEKAGCPGLSALDIEGVMRTSAGFPVVFQDPQCGGPAVAALPDIIDALEAYLATDTECTASGDASCDGEINLIDTEILIRCWYGPMTLSAGCRGSALASTSRDHRPMVTSICTTLRSFRSRSAGRRRGPAVTLA